MRALIFIAFIIQSLFSYALVVKSEKEAKLLNQKYNIQCQKQNDYFVCATSEDINQMLQLKDFLKREKIKTYIIENSQNSPKPKKTFTPKTGYCIQIASSTNKDAIEKLFRKYENLPLARVEKINKFYVIRVAEGSFQEVKELKNRIKQGFVRKCDLIPQRIVYPKTFSTPNSFNPFPKPTPILQKPKISLVSLMYQKLNSGDFIQAKQIANKLKNTKDAPKAYEVLGIIAMKQNQWKKACNYLKKSNNKKLYKTACYTYYLKTGYEYLSINPKKALNYFKKAKTYKNTEDVQLAIAYAYLNSNQYDKALNIFQTLYKKDPNNDKILQGYILALYKKKDYQKINELQKENPDKKYLFLTYETYINLQKANELIKQKKYKEAEEILINLYKNNPENINVMLALGNLYLKTNQLNKAEDFYKNVLIISPQNVYAIQGLKAIAIKRKNYNKALKLAKLEKKLGINSDTSSLKFLYYYQLATKALKNKECKKALDYINNLRILKPQNPNVYVLYGDYYKECKNDKKEALINYSKAYKLSNGNFDITLKFLYSLLNYDMFEQIKILLSTIKADKLTNEQKAKLKEFYSALYLKYAAKLYKEKKYKEAIKAADIGLNYDPTNKDFYVIKAWSCFRLKEYKCAQESFKTAIKLDKNNEELKYDLALVEIKLGNRQKALSLLNSIENTNNKQLKLKIADAYMSINEIEKAEKILNSIKIKPKQKTIIITPKNDNEFFPDILLNKNSTKIIKKTSFTKEDKKLQNEIYQLKKKLELKKSNYLSYIEIGLNSKAKSGTKGLDKLNSNLLYLKSNYFFNPKNNIFLKLGLISLSNGGDPDFTQVGSPSQTGFENDYITSTTGYLWKIGYQHRGKIGVDLALSTTPLNTSSKVSSTLTGYAKATYSFNNNKIALKIAKESIKDSILSYIGENDPYTDGYWGRVNEKYIQASYERKLDKNDSLVYTSLLVSSINGKNTHTNNRFTFELLPLIYIGNNISDSDYAGIYLNYTSYNKNENHFYYGYGGYFSPQHFLLIAPRYEGYLLNSKYALKYYLMSGLLNFKDDKTHTGLAFEGGVLGKYKIYNRLFAKGGIDLRKSADYSEFFLNLSLEYYFGKKLKFTKQELNKNLKEMLKQW